MLWGLQCDLWFGLMASALTKSSRSPLASRDRWGGKLHQVAQLRRLEWKNLSDIQTLPVLNGLLHVIQTKFSTSSLQFVGCTYLAARRAFSYMDGLAFQLRH
jgi:hypothetical protein